MERSPSLRLRLRRRYGLGCRPARPEPGQIRAYGRCLIYLVLCLVILVFSHGGPAFGFVAFFAASLAPAALLVVAVHEAAHAVAAWACGQKPFHVRIGSGSLIRSICVEGVQIDPRAYVFGGGRPRHAVWRDPSKDHRIRQTSVNT